MIRNVKSKQKIRYRLDVYILIRKGNIKTSSTSKTKKIILIKKNRSVNGKRALNLGLNPHSKGLIFSPEKITFFEKNLPRNNKSRDRIKEIEMLIIIFIIN
jgi:hypothetical protein